MADDDTFFRKIADSDRLLGSAPVIGLAAMHGVMPRVVAAAGLGVLVEVVAWRGGRAAYASRAPPGLAG